MNRRKWSIFIAALLGTTLPVQTVAAACINPPGVIGEMIYNGDYSVVQFCDGTDWVGMANKADAGLPDGDKGDITVSGAGLAWSVDSGAISYAKLQDVSATGRLLGRASAGAGSVEELSLGTGLSLTGSTLAVGGLGGSALSPDSLDFSEFKEAMTLDASTDFAAAGTKVLSITNTGTANSFVVRDEAADPSPFVIDAAGNVGIGTASPGSALHVLGTNTKLTVEDPQGSARRIEIVPGTGSIDAYNTAIHLNRFGGNPVSIGFSGAARLRVGQAIESGTFGSTALAYLGNTEAGTPSLVVDKAPSMTADIVQVRSATSSGADIVVIKPDGRVGIGTASPHVSKLNVAGDVRIGAVTEDNGGVAGYGDRLHFSGGDDFANANSDNNDPLWAARYNEAAENTQLRINIGDGVDDDDRFEIGTTGWDNGQWYSRFSVTATGKVGIGTTAPIQPLHIAAAAPGIRLTDTDTNAFSLVHSDSAAGSLSLSADEGNTAVNSAINFYIDGSQKAVLSSGGALGVNTGSDVAPNFYPA